MSPAKPVLHLVCNAHIDPSWLWSWEEGAAETLATFRSSADICEESKSLIFCHNESLLYQWVLEYEPALFKRIQRLVKQGRWHIMGGWYLQPDCNLPAGESFIRQILLGIPFFKKHFGMRPKTAINLDPFGHSRGLVQILTQCGYENYLITRPNRNQQKIEGDDDFIWEGYDGSRVHVCRPPYGYATSIGRVMDKVSHERKETLAIGSRNCNICMWGVGNHGGGPSRQDLAAIEACMKEEDPVEVRHSTPDAYFADQRKRKLAVHKAELNPWAVGCYTTQARIKQGHRRLENALYLGEKMAAAAWVTTGMPYPAVELAEATRSLALSEFHDSLPGSSIQEVEEDVLQTIAHGCELLDRVRARAFFRLSAGQPKAQPDWMPILVFNPHPYPVHRTIRNEVWLAEAKSCNERYSNIEVYLNGRRVPAQVEKEPSNLPYDWRRSVVFETVLPPMQMTRVDCRPVALKQKPPHKAKVAGGRIRIKGKILDVTVNALTGLVDRFMVNGKSVLKPGAFSPLVMKDDHDPWGMNVVSFRNLEGSFTVVDPAESARVSGVDSETLPAVRVVEDGDVRTVVEAVLGYQTSRIVQTYRISKLSDEFEVEVRVFWNERMRMLKLAVPTVDKGVRYLGQTAFGVEPLKTNGDETVAQKWMAAVSDRHGWAFTAVNTGMHGSDCRDGEVRLSLLRSSTYAAHPVGKDNGVARDRFSPTIDQGERVFKFWFKAGPASQRLAAIDREALAINEDPMSLCCFPSGDGRKPVPMLDLSDPVVQVTTIKHAEKGAALIVRLFEPTGRARKTRLSVVKEFSIPVSLKAWQFVTLRINVKKRSWKLVSPLEE